MTRIPLALRPLLAALLLPALAACVAPPGEEGAEAPPGLFGPREAAAPEPLPPNVLAALPPGVPSSVVLEDGQGCYLYSIERTDPPSGYPLRDVQGNQVCEGGAASPIVPAAPVEVAGLAADVAASVPPAVPSGADAVLDPSDLGGPALATPPAGGEAIIDITPVLDAPLPPAAGASAPAPGAVPAAPALTPGDITPPAPLAPLN